MKPFIYKNAIKVTATIIIAVILFSSVTVMGSSESFAETGNDIVTAEDIPEDHDADALPELSESSGQTVDPENIPAAPAKAVKKEKKQKLKLQNGSSDFSDDGFSSAAVINVNDAVNCQIDTAGSIYTYRFDCSTDGKYYFFSSSNDGDPDARVVEYNNALSTYEEIAYGDEEGDNNNFKIEFNAKAGYVYYLQAKMYYSDNTGSFTVNLTKDEYEASLSVSLKKSTGKATVKGTVTGDTFYALYVDDRRVEDADISGRKSFTYTLNMKNYEVGLHTVYAVLYNHDSSDQYVYYSKAVPTYIYGTPSNKIGYYTSGYKYFTIAYAGNSYKYDYNCSVYLDYKQAGGKWKKNFGPVTSSAKKKSKLKANKKYTTRLFYGKKFSYGGKTYFFSGRTTKKLSKNFSLKTGAKKPSVKSIKITKAKVSSYTYRQPIWNSYWIGTTYYTYISGYRTVKAYQTKFKVTVKLRKKPGTYGIYIGTKRLKGNKKTYTTTFTQSGKLKGKKLKVAVYSYQHSKYGGYSPIYRKKVKVR